MTEERAKITLGQRISTIAWFLLGLGFLLALPVLLGFSPWSLPVVIGVAALLALPVAAVFHGLKRRTQSGTFMRRWLGSGLALLFVLSTLAATPIYYLSAVVAAKPLTVPQAVITNGQKTIIFQGMTHVGTEAFYKSVIYDLQHAIGDGYVIYYEGVRPDPAGEKWFSETLANGGDLSAEYSKLGEVCGLSFQGDYFKLLSSDMREHPERHVAADVSTLEMKQEYERMIASDKSFAERVEKAAAEKRNKGEASDTFAKFLNWSQDGEASHRALGGIVCRGAMNLILARKAPSDMDPLVLDYRNRMLVDRILSDQRPRIYVNYGSGHLPGILKLLQASDPRWKVVSIKWMRTIEAPEELKGQI